MVGLLPGCGPQIMVTGALPTRGAFLVGKNGPMQISKRRATHSFPPIALNQSGVIFATGIPRSRLMAGYTYLLVVESV